MNDSPAVSRPARPALRRTLRIAAWTLGVLALAAALAALLLPGYLKGVAIEQIREQLHREARIEGIVVNPLLLSARVRGLTIAQADGKTELFGFDELHARVGLRSLLRRAPVIEALTLERPRIHLARLAVGRYNISDIVEALLAKSSSPEGPRFALNSLAINNASITFDDRPADALHKIEQLRVVLPALSSFADDRDVYAEPVLSAIVNGQPLDLKGRTKPFDASLETSIGLHFANLDVPTYLAYSPVPLPLRLERGKLTTALDIALLRARDRGLTATLKGTLRLDDIVLREPDAPAGSVPIAAVRAIEAQIAELRWPENSVRLDRLVVIAPELVLRRGTDGHLNWERVFAREANAAAAPPAPVAASRPAEPASAPASAKASPPLQFAIGQTDITEGAATFEDLAAGAGAFRGALKSFEIHARGLSNAEGAQAVIDSAAVTDAGESHANTATLTLKPFGVTGEVNSTMIRLARYQPYFGAVLAADIDGTVAAHARYTVNADYEVNVSDAGIAVTALLIRDPARSEFARAGSFAVTGVELDSAKHTVGIGGVALRQCRVALARDPAGAWNFDALVKKGANSAAPPAGEPSSANARGAAPADWVTTIGQVSVERCALQFDDRAAARGSAAKIVVDSLDGRVDGWSTRPNARGRIDVKARLNGAGRVALRGTAGIAPAAADLDVEVDGLDLVPLQPYVADKVNLRLTSGTLSSRGKLGISITDALSARYRGDASVLKFATTTRADGEDFLNWGALQVQGLQIALNAPAAAGGAPVPFALTLDDLALSDFYSRLIVNADGTLNVQKIVIASESGVADSAAKGADSSAVSPATTSPPGTAPAPVTIARVSLDNGRINFSDRLIKPNYSANLADVSGTVTGLSSDFASRASVDLRARYDPSAPVAIKGTINPLRGNLFVDLAASVRDIELSPFTPYAQKYAGYGITKGKLSFQVKYLIEERKLTAENSLLLDQLTFGEKIDSPDATKLPVLFAVSLLKNARGEIDLDLPVGGSLDDPQFSVFSIVLKILGNLLVKAATSPFALLGALAGGSGEDLAFADFQPGVAASFAPGQEEKLQKIARALTERPALRLDIAGRVDAEADGQALHRRALLRKVAAQRQEEQVSKGEASESAETMAIPPADYPRLLKRAFDNEKFAKPVTAEMPVAEMEKLILANIAVSPDDLRELGERRARTAKEALGKAGVAGERMFIVAAAEPAAAEVEGKPAAKRGPRVDFVLK